MENLLFLGVPILKHIRVVKVFKPYSTHKINCSDIFAEKSRGAFAPHIFSGKK